MGAVVAAHVEVSVAERLLVQDVGAGTTEVRRVDDVQDHQGCEEGEGVAVTVEVVPPAAVPLASCVRAWDGQLVEFFVIVSRRRSLDQQVNGTRRFQPVAAAKIFIYSF